MATDSAERSTLHLPPITSDSQQLRILPLGGLGEIGMNCMVLEYADEILVVDCGLLFSDLDHFGVEFVIPDFTYLKERREKVKGFLITHGHEDHIGALAFAFKAGIKAPIYASGFTSKMILERFKEYPEVGAIDLRTFQMGEELKFKHFRVKTVSVNHSIVDAAALVIDTPLGKVIHTGDFKIDPAPYFGQQVDVDYFAKLGEEGVLLLMSDSTNVERHEHTLSESTIYQRFEQLLAATRGLTVISMFASNVARMSQIFNLAKKFDKKILLAGRSMETNARLGADSGYMPDLNEVQILQDELDDYPREKVIVLSTGSQGEHRSALIRIANGEHSKIKLRDGDLVLMSSKFIPGNEKAIGRMINSLFKQGAEVLYESVHEIHTSGHATRPELQTMIEAIKPRFFMPIHGEYRHLVHHAALAKECGVKPENVLIAVNGDVVELTPHGGFDVIDHLEEDRVLVEGREGNEMTRLVLRERRQMGETGMVFSLMVRNVETRRIMSGPEIIFRGLVAENMEGHLIEEARKVARRVVIDYEDQLKKTGSPQMDLQETVRVELRRFFNNNIGKKPVVLPIILDL